MKLALSNARNALLEDNLFSLFEKLNIPLPLFIRYLVCICRLLTLFFLVSVSVITTGLFRQKMTSQNVKTSKSSGLTAPFKFLLRTIKAFSGLRTPLLLTMKASSEMFTMSTQLMLLSEICGNCVCKLMGAKMGRRFLLFLIVTHLPPL